MLLVNSNLKDIINTNTIDMDIPMPTRMWQIDGQAQIDATCVLQLADIFTGV